MPEVCSNCGLPKEICVCETIAMEEEKIKVFTTAKRYGKLVTVVEGLSKDVDSREILREMKTKLACGGTLKDGEIELQGNHKDRVVQILIKLGFRKDQIEVR